MAKISLIDSFFFIWYIFGYDKHINLTKQVISIHEKFAIISSSSAAEAVRALSEI